MKIIRHRERIESTTYQRSFEYEDMRGAGFAFDCDKDGNVVPLKPIGQSSWDACVKGEIEVLRDAKYHWVNGELEVVPGTGRRVMVKLIDKGVVSFEHSYVEPAIGLCACGEEVSLGRFTNTCDCGRDYNSAGQLLAPRSQWGEETGESIDDILSVDY